MNDWQSSLQQFLDSNPDLPEGEIAEKPAAHIPKPRLDILLDRKGRAGKTASIITGFGDETTDDEVAALAGRLKQRLGTGGSARGGEILIQGDRRNDIALFLKNEGYKTRLI